MTKESKKTYVLTGCVLVLVVMFFAGCTTTENVVSKATISKFDWNIDKSTRQGWDEFPAFCYTKKHVELLKGETKKRIIGKPTILLMWK